MARTKGASRLRKADEAVEDLLEQTDAKIDELEKLLVPYEKIKERIDKLKASRRALLGGSRLTGEGNSRVRQEDIVEYLDENPGSSTSTIATALKVPQTTISSHLYRGKNERFLTKNKKWWNRDPANGLTTADDIEEE